MSINFLQDFSLADVDGTLDKIPVCSTFSNLTALFVKAVVLPCKDQTSISQSSYLARIEGKSFSKCTLLLVPFVGQFTLFRQERHRVYLEECLQAWKEDATDAGNKEEAARRVLEVFERDGCKLDLSNLGLSSLPRGLETLQMLRELILKENELSELPEEIWELEELVKLDLSYNRFFEISSQIGKLNSLEKLYLDHNELLSIPDEIGHLQALVKLRLDYNRLSFLPVAIGILFGELEELNLSYNELTSIPLQIEHLWNKLKKLSLAGNLLSTIPEGIWQLKNLQDLDVSGNPLEEISSDIASLNSLRNLYISPEQMERFPREVISQFRSLRVHFRDCGVSNRSYPIFSLVERWQRQASTLYSLDPLNRLSAENQLTIAEWLSRLESSRDFKNSNKQQLAEVVMGILDAVLNPSENGDFPSFFFDQVQSNNTDCKDRAAMALNELFTVWKIKTHVNSSLQAAAPFIASSLKTHALRMAIAKTISGESQKESVEIYLYYEIAIKQIYKEPKNSHLVAPLTLIEEMGYPKMGERSKISVKRLFNLVESSYLDYLLEFPLFERILDQDEVFKIAWDRQDEEFVDAIEKAAHFSKEEYDSLLKERKAAKLEMAKRALLVSL